MFILYLSDSFLIFDILPFGLFDSFTEDNLYHIAKQMSRWGQNDITVVLAGIALLVVLVLRY